MIAAINVFILFVILPAMALCWGAGAALWDLEPESIKHHPVRAAVGGILGVLLYAALMLSVPYGGYGDPMSKGLMRYAPNGTTLEQDQTNITACQGAKDADGQPTARQFQLCLQDRGYTIPVDDEEEDAT